MADDRDEGSAWSGPGGTMSAERTGPSALAIVLSVLLHASLLGLVVKAGPALKLPEMSAATPSDSVGEVLGGGDTFEIDTVVEGDDGGDLEGSTKSPPAEESPPAAEPPPAEPPPAEPPPAEPPPAETAPAEPPPAETAPPAEPPPSAVTPPPVDTPPPAAPPPPAEAPPPVDTPPPAEAPPPAVASASSVPPSASAAPSADQRAAATPAGSASGNPTRRYGAAGAGRGVKDLGRAFTRAIPAAVSADAIWSELPLGKAADRVSVVIAVGDDRKVDEVSIPEGAPEVVQRVMRRTMALLRAGRFALVGVEAAGKQPLRLTVEIEQREPIEHEGAQPGDAFGLRHDPPGDGTPGRAYFSLVSGRFIRITVEVLAPSSN